MIDRNRSPLVCLIAASLLACGSCAGGQVLARPGWAGSGISTEAWWRGAVFYRIAPEHFQDSDGDGVGDLRGIAQRLGYLQTLGVDAVVLQLPFDDTGFDDLQKELTQRHMRLVVGLDRSGTSAASENPESPLPAAAAHWLARGAAGILLPPPAGRSGAGEDALVQALRHAVARMPGERVLIAAGASSSSDASRSSKTPVRAAKSSEPQLVLRTLPLQEVGELTPSAVDTALSASGAAGASEPVLQLAASTAGPEAPNNAAIAVAALLTQRSAVLLEYGEELGQPAPERMPWTPSNVTPPPPAPEQPVKPMANPAGPFGASVYGAYHEYVPPPKPKMPPPDAMGLPDPATLPGFSARAPTDKGMSSDVRSVVLQERDPLSTLGLYKKLLGLHRGNEAMRKGSLDVLRGQEELADGSAAQGQTAGWLRRAPSQTLVFAVNCGDRTVRLTLDSELARLRLGEGFLRSVFSPGQILGRRKLLLAPHSVFVGEFVRGY